MELAQLEDLEAIRTLRTLYSHCYDAQDIEGLCGLFDNDAVCNWDSRHGGVWNGLCQIREHFLYSFQEYPGYFTVLHVTANHYIEITSPTTARGRCYLLDYNFLKPERADAPLGTVGVYEDLYIKTNQGWKFQRISLDFLWPYRWIQAAPLQYPNEQKQIPLK